MAEAGDTSGDKGGQAGNAPLTALVFRLGALRLGIPVAAVEGVVPAPRPTPLPQAPATVAGLVDIHGSVLPCVDLRRRVDGRSTEIGAATRLVLLCTSRRRLAVLADQTDGVETLAPQGAADLVPLAPGAGLVRASAGPDGIVLLHDVEALLSDEEESRLDAALAAQDDTHGSAP